MTVKKSTEIFNQLFRIKKCQNIHLYYLECGILPNMQ